LKIPNPFKEKKMAIGKVISERASSKATSGSHLSAFDNMIPPRIEFKRRQNNGGFVCCLLE